MCGLTQIHNRHVVIKITFELEKKDDLDTGV